MSTEPINKANQTTGAHDTERLIDTQVIFIDRAIDLLDNLRNLFKDTDFKITDIKLNEMNDTISLDVAPTDDYYEKN